jgi:type VI secretion system VasD/TssJ family lipoprotein
VDRNFAIWAFIVLLCTGLNGACATIPGAPQWEYEEKAIEVKIEADKQLNLVDGKPHALALYVYQLSDPNAFKELAQNKSGLLKMIENSRFDPSAVEQEKIIVQPGEKKTVSLDRAERAKFVGLVAAFYDLPVGNASRLFDIPVVVATTGFLIRNQTQKPGKLSMDLLLGAQGLQIRGKKHEKQ